MAIAKSYRVIRSLELKQHTHKQTHIGYHWDCLLLLLSNRPTWGLLSKYLTYYCRRLLFPVKSSPEVDIARERFRALVASRTFTYDWFDNNIPVWVPTLSHLKNCTEVLEIGSYEGRSVLFFLSYFPQARVTAIDPWTDDARVEERFDRNVWEPYPRRVNKLRCSSDEGLAHLSSWTFDIVYIDGSHYANDVMSDAVKSWKLLRRQGIMIFDDYTWNDGKKSACLAIHLFVRLIDGEYDILHVAHQVILRKR